ncbi:MAG: hypothetical protein PHT42_09895, partial [Thermotogota bacterium]|nr:hypothetical protein [Thermotogota bacterium]
VQKSGNRYALSLQPLQEDGRITLFNMSKKTGRKAGLFLLRVYGGKTFGNPNSHVSQISYFYGNEL